METFRDGVADKLDNLVQQARTLIDPNGLANAVNPGLALLRAFGDPPAVPNLGFDLTVIDYAPAIGYFFNSPAAVTVSQNLQAAAAEASQVVDGLSQLGLTLPTTALLDRLIPGDLSKLNISDLLPNIAGLNLATLFSAVGVPESAANNIHVSHKLDPQTLRASLDISLDFTLAESATLFSIGPATVTIDTCNFEATVHIEGGVGQAASRTSEGSITGDWHVTIGGLTIVTFVTTTLSFDAGGHLHFSISPERVRLDGALSFLADFLQGAFGGKGFSINLLPSGVQCILDLPFPDCSFGAFGITNLRLGALFGLNISNGLNIQVGANLGRKTAPFTLTIFVLGGAGWFEAGLTYHTQDGTLTADVSIGIMASASISISLGPISGGVYIYFGITTEFHSGGTNAGLAVGILLLVEGRVSLLGFIDVDIMLLLEAEYTSGGGLVGRGQITLSIKICWCFTLNVSAGVEYTFGNSPSSLPRAHSTPCLQRIGAHLAAAAPPALTPPPPPTPTNSAQATPNQLPHLRENDARHNCHHLHSRRDRSPFAGRSQQSPLHFQYFRFADLRFGRQSLCAGRFSAVELEKRRSPRSPFQRRERNQAGRHVVSRYEGHGATLRDHPACCDRGIHGAGKSLLQHEPAGRSALLPLGRPARRRRSPQSAGRKLVESSLTPRRGRRPFPRP